MIWGLSADSSQNNFTSDIHIHTEKQTDVVRTCERVGEVNVASLSLRGGMT